MRVERLEVLVEEPSMQAALQHLLPKMLPDETTYEIYDHECKQALLDRLPQRLSGYGQWLPKDWRILIVVDRDQDDCIKLKRRITDIVGRTGLAAKQGDGDWQVGIRLAVEELEAWYFGDWQAVTTAYPKVGSHISQQAKYRDPDAIPDTWEAFERVVRKAGYFQGGLRKIEAARRIAEHMDPSRNRSGSFRAFRGLLANL